MITLRLEHEDGEVVAICPFPDSLREVLPLMEFDPRFPLMSGMAPYEDTLYNGRQCLVLAKEFEAFSADRTREVREGIATILRIVSGCKRGMFVRFVSD